MYTTFPRLALLTKHKRNAKMGETSKSKIAERNGLK